MSSGAAADRPLKILLLGLGNPILSDDAVGIRLARYMKSRLSGVPGLDFVEECSVGGLNLLEVIAGYDRLVVLDSMKTADLRPGYWCRFTAESLRETLNLNNVHDVNFATALVLGRNLGMRLPLEKDIHIFAVGVLDNLTFSETMTEPLENAFDKYAKEIYSEIAEMI